MENGLAAAEGEEKLFPDTHAQKVDPGKPASLTWKRQLNSNGKIPVQFGLSFREISHMLPMGLRLWRHIKQEAAKERATIFDFSKKHILSSDHGIPLGGIGISVQEALEEAIEASFNTLDCSLEYVTKAQFWQINFPLLFPVRVVKRFPLYYALGLQTSPKKAQVQALNLGIGI